MPTNSLAMRAALKEIVVPVLRSMGFKGSLPHYRRITADKIDLLTFQFNKYGGSFIIEIASCSPTGITHYWGKHVPPNKVTAYDTIDRIRLQPSNDTYDYGWFRFENLDCNSVALSVVPYIHKAEELWKIGIKVGEGLGIVYGYDSAIGWVEQND
jgi:hypothetical protein